MRIQILCALSIYMCLHFPVAQPAYAHAAGPARPTAGVSATFIPQTDLSERGSHAPGKGPLDPVGMRSWIRLADIVVNISTNAAVPKQNLVKLKF